MKSKSPKSPIKNRPSLRTQYSPRPLKKRTLSLQGSANKTKQSFKDECDINNIVKKYQKTGFAPVSGVTPEYGEQDPPDFTKVQMAMATVKTMFERLPEGERGRFASVSELIDAISTDFVDVEFDQVEVENPEPTPTQTTSESEALALDNEK